MKPIFQSLVESGQLAKPLFAFYLSKVRPQGAARKGRGEGRKGVTDGTVGSERFARE